METKPYTFSNTDTVPVAPIKPDTASEQHSPVIPAPAVQADPKPFRTK